MSDSGFSLEKYWEKHGQPFTEEEIEWHRLWFEFLKLSDRKKWSEALVRDFGNVSGEFTEWWSEHSHLFNRLRDDTIREVKSQFDFHASKAAGPDGDIPGTIVMSVPMHLSKAELRLAFEEMLTKHHKGTAGRPKFDGAGYAYSLHCRPDTEMLRKILAVYQVYSADQLKPRKEQMPLWRIEEVVSETIPLIDKTSPAASYIWKTKDIDASVIESRRRSQHTTVRKYLNYAEEILENIVHGDFPMYAGGNPHALDAWNSPPVDWNTFVKKLAGKWDEQ